MSPRIVDLVQGPSETQAPDPLERVQRRLHRELIDSLDFEVLAQWDAEQTRTRLQQTLAELIKNHDVVMSHGQREALFTRVLDDVTGFGPLERLLQQDDISDILVNGPQEIWVERHGKLQRTDLTFRDDDHLVHVIRRIVSSVGRRIDESSPLVDARLEDGTRVNAVIPPITLDGPTLSLRRFSTTPLRRQDLIDNRSVPEVVLDFLGRCVQGRMNLLVSGGTGSGKTTLLNVLSGFIGHEERVVTIEDAAELRLQQPHVVRMETRPSNLEGRGEVDARMLVRNALRMRPDRIVVGEIRSHEAIDMLQAMNTGHDGSMSTVHANSPAHAISRLKTMVAVTIGNLPDRAIAEIIADALQIIVQVRRGLDGVRRIVSITEVAGFDGEQVLLRPLIRFQQQGVGDDGRVQGSWQAIEASVVARDALESIGMSLPDLGERLPVEA